MKNNNVVSTYFSANGEGFKVEGTGDATITAARRHGRKIHPGYPVLIEGFEINGDNFKVNLAVTPPKTMYKKHSKS